MSKINGIEVEVIWADARKFGGVHLNGTHAAYIEGERKGDGYHARLQSNVSKLWYEGRHLVISQAVRQAITAMIEAEKIEA